MGAKLRTFVQAVEDIMVSQHADRVSSLGLETH